MKKLIMAIGFSLLPLTTLAQSPLMAPSDPAQAIGEDWSGVQAGLTSVNLSVARLQKSLTALIQDKQKVDATAAKASEAEAWYEKCITDPKCVDWATKK